MLSGEHRQEYCYYKHRYVKFPLSEIQYFKMFFTAQTVRQRAFFSVKFSIYFTIKNYFQSQMLEYLEHS